MTAVLEADFTKRFADGPLIQANLRLAVSGFCVTVLFGPSGVGKTTVLRCLAALDRPDSGHIRMAEQIWYDSARGICLPPQRRDIGYLAQDYALFPHLTVIGNIAYGLPQSLASSQRCQELLDLLSLTGLQERYPRQLSGGQQQRVALARAVARHPRLLLLDEPLSALDDPTREQLRTQLRHWLAQMGVPALVVTHDLTEALALGDTLAIMDQGKICQVGPVEQVINQPASVEVARIVGFETIQPGIVALNSHGQITVLVGGIHLRAEAGKIRSGDVFVGIRAEDVRLTNLPAPPNEAENIVPAVVRGATRERNLVRVRLDCGFDLTALVPPHVAAAMELNEGSAVSAVIATSAVQVIENR